MSYLIRRVLAKPRLILDALIFPRINGPIVVSIVDFVDEVIVLDVM